MRPTDLQFRNPREVTPDPYDVVVTAYGQGLLGRRRRRNGGRGVKSTFSGSERFKVVQSDKSSFWRGPGSYDLSYMSIAGRKPGKVHVYKEFHVPGNKSRYFYCGNSLVMAEGKKRGEEGFLGGSKQRKEGIQRSRSTTASSKYNSMRKALLSPVLGF